VIQVDKRLRASAFFAILAAFTLIDEIIKEGYAFDPNDLLNPALTHEKLFVLFLLLCLILGLKRGRYGKQTSGEGN
jgi:hypothetical protein